MWASIIIDTSLAPSPIAREIQAQPYLLERWTTCAFWAGLTLQQMTEDAQRPILKKVSSRIRSPSMHVSDFPSITITLLWDFQIFSLIFSNFTFFSFLGNPKPSFRTLSYVESKIYLISSVYSEIEIGTFLSPYILSSWTLMMRTSNES